MQLVDMFFDEIEDAKKRKVPFIIPIGTIEYHALHASCGTDTMVINGTMRELEKTKEVVVCPPIWYGVASYAVAGPESGTIHVDVDVYENYIYCILKSMIYGGVHSVLLSLIRLRKVNLQALFCSCLKMSISKYFFLICLTAGYFRRLASLCQAMELVHHQLMTQFLRFSH